MYARSATAFVPSMSGGRSAASHASHVGNRPAGSDPAAIDERERGGDARMVGPRSRRPRCHPTTARRRWRRICRADRRSPRRRRLRSWCRSRRREPRNRRASADQRRRPGAQPRPGHRPPPPTAGRLTTTRVPARTVARRRQPPTGARAALRRRRRPPADRGVRRREEGRRHPRDHPCAQHSRPHRHRDPALNPVAPTLQHAQYLIDRYDPRRSRDRDGGPRLPPVVPHRLAGEVPGVPLVAGRRRPAGELAVHASGAGATSTDLGVPRHHPSQRRDLRGVLVGEVRRPGPQHLHEWLVDVHDRSPASGPQRMSQSSFWLPGASSATSPRPVSIASRRTMKVDECSIDIRDLTRSSSTTVVWPASRGTMLPSWCTSIAHVTNSVPSGAARSASTCVRSLLGSH